MLRDRGDTIIEVIFATTIFSMLAIGALSIMHQGSAMAQRALEVTLVREQIDAQADALRFLNRAYVADFGKNEGATAKWNAVIVSQAVSQATPFDKMTEDAKCIIPSSAFALNIQKLDAANPLLPLQPNAGTYAKVRFDLPIPAAEGVWIQAVRSSGHYDFHIRACWQTPGEDQPITLGTIVRLYDPQS